MLNFIFKNWKLLSVLKNILVFGKGPQTLEFFLNGAKLSVNTLNSVKTFRNETRSLHQFHISVLSSLFTHIYTYYHLQWRYKCVKLTLLFKFSLPMFSTKLLNLYGLKAKMLKFKGWYICISFCARQNQESNMDQFRGYTL